LILRIGLLQGVGVEDVALVQVHLAADDLVLRHLVADEGDPTHEVLLVLLHGEDDVHDLLLRVGLALRERLPLKVAFVAVEIAELLVALLDPRLLVDVAGLELEERPGVLFLEDGEARELDLAHAILVPFRDRDLELHPAHGLLLEEGERPGVSVEVGNLGLTDGRGHVAAIEEIVFDPPLVALLRVRPLVLGIGALAGEPGEVPEAGLLDLRHGPAELALREGLVPHERDLAHAGAIAVVEDEGNLHAAAAAHGLRLVLHAAERAPLLVEHLLEHRVDASGLRFVEEAVDAQGHLALLELVLDGGTAQRLAPPVVDDLDAPALLDHEAHDLSRRSVLDVEQQVVEEARLPQAAEVLAQAGLVVAVAGLGGDVVEEGVLRDEAIAQDADRRDHLLLGGSHHRGAEGRRGWRRRGTSHRRRGENLFAGAGAGGGQEDAQRRPRRRRRMSRPRTQRAGGPLPFPGSQTQN